MVAPCEAISTITFIGNYCSIYRDLFANVPEEAVEYGDWQRFERMFSDVKTEERYIQSDHFWSAVAVALLDIKK